jgi:PAS domain S-box-containing protein
MVFAQATSLGERRTGMAHRLRGQQHSLSRQIVLPMIALVILTALAVGIPAILLLQNQLEQQAQAISQQGSQTTHILITNKLNDLSYLAVLTAQRPTLGRLIRENDLDELGPYLETFRQGAGLDAVMLCRDSREVVLQAGDDLSSQACRLESASRVVLFDSVFSQGWLLADQPVPFELEGIDVLVGVRLDDAFAAQLESETGLKQTLLYTGEYLASSFGDESPAWQSVQPDLLATPAEAAPYYSLRSRYQDTGLEIVVSLPASAFIEIRQRLNRIIGGSILLVILLGSGLGLLSARRISRPLEQLRDAAHDLRHGDLTTPVSVETSVRELALLSYVLDDARATLNHTISELRNEKAWTDHLLESVVEGIITLDRNKNITFFSHGAEQISGWEQEDVLSRPVDEIFPLFNGEGTFSQRLPDPGGKQKIVVKMHNGRPATLAITRASMGPPESGKTGAVLVLRDVSSEESIRRLLGDFLANITHEFRTPLSALAASSELLLDQLPDLEQDELLDLLNNIHLGILNLQTLIDNLLEGASIETGRFRVFVQPSDLPAIIQETVQAISPLAAKYGVEIETEIPSGIPPVLADPRRTGQVLVNLLSNALKWGAPQTTAQGETMAVPPESLRAGTRSITVSAARKSGCIEVSVSDRGPGLSPEQQAGLFHPFPNPPSENRPQQGTGLGLSVVKAIVEAQGGQVGMHDRPGGGAIFWFTLLETPPDSDAGAAS